MLRSTVLMKRILDLRASRGLTQAAIARELGVTQACVSIRLRQALSLYIEEFKELAQTLRIREDATLDALIISLWETYEKSLTKKRPDLAVVDRLLAALSRRSRLWGYDAPTTLAATAQSDHEDTPDWSRLSLEQLRQLERLTHLALGQPVATETPPVSRGPGFAADVEAPPTPGGHDETGGPPTSA